MHDPPKNVLFSLKSLDSLLAPGGLTAQICVGANLAN